MTCFKLMLGCCHVNGLEVAASLIWAQKTLVQTQKFSYKRHRFPPQIIAHVVWLYVWFNLSLR